MSRIRQNVPVPPPAVEPEFSGEEEAFEEYQPQHPVLAFQAQSQEPQKDHLEDYIEVNPFAEQEAKQDN
jgi:hypothetical protein